MAERDKTKPPPSAEGTSGDKKQLEFKVRKRRTSADPVTSKTQQQQDSGTVGGGKEEERADGALVPGEPRKKLPPHIAAFVPPKQSTTTNPPYGEEKPFARDAAPNVAPPSTPREPRRSFETRPSRANSEDPSTTSSQTRPPRRDLDVAQHQQPRPRRDSAASDFQRPPRPSDLSATPRRRQSIGSASGRRNPYPMDFADRGYDEPGEYEPRPRWRSFNDIPRDRLSYDDDDDDEFDRGDGYGRPRRSSLGRRSFHPDDAEEEYADQARPRRSSLSSRGGMQNSAFAGQTAFDFQPEVPPYGPGNGGQAMVATVRKPAAKEEPPLGKCDRCITCIQTSPFFPSRTRALELFAILLDALAVVFFILALILPWVASVPPCKDCPDGFSAGAFLENNNIKVTYGIFRAGSMTNDAFLPASDYFQDLNRSHAEQWAQEYDRFYFAPMTSVLWKDLSTAQLCGNRSSPAYVLWAAPYQMCPYKTPPQTIGAQALLITACCFAGMSMMSMIAARRGRSGFAQFSTLCSLLSLGFGLGGTLWFIEWGYVSHHQIIAGRGSVPIRVVSLTLDDSSTAIIPVTANFKYVDGYFLAIFAFIFEAITSVISWIAGTERCWWMPDDDVVYGSTSWMAAGNLDYSNMRRPTLMEMQQRQNLVEQRMMAEDSLVRI